MESKILNLFLFNHKIKFSEIEKSLNIRSNKLAYHLKQLVKKKILCKKGEFYLLSETTEHLLPYLSDKKAVLSIILIHIGNKKSCFLFKRNKRPFKDKLSLPGGRLIVGESIEGATKRIIKDKFNLNVKFKKINSVSLEHVKKNKKIAHSFSLIFVSAVVREREKNKVKLVDIKKNKSKIIKSDYQLITKDVDLVEKIKTISSVSPQNL